MSDGLTYDTGKLWGMLQELEPKRRVQALKGGIRKASRETKRVAVANLRASGLRSNSKVEAGIRNVIFKNRVGFRVTVGTKRGKRIDYSAMTKGEAAKAKAKARLRIVPLWAEGGTAIRQTRRGYARGFMGDYRFMEKTQRDVDGKATEMMHRGIAENIKKTVEKYGSKME